MSQSAEQPIRLTYDKLYDKFKANFPTLVAPLEHAKPKLERGEGAEELANIIKCEVKLQEEPSAFVYTWKGQKSRVFEYRVLKPFDPTPERKHEVTQEMPEAAENPPQESADSSKAAQTDAQASVDAQETSELTPDAGEDSSTQQPLPKALCFPSGLFTTLAELIGDCTLLMTMAKQDDELTVNVMPFSDDKETNISAVCVTATPAELDEGFAKVIRVKVEARKSLAAQIEALRAAEKDLADAKKAEADAKKAEAEKKKKAAETKRKEEEKKKQEEAQGAEKAKSQEALF